MTSLPFITRRATLVAALVCAAAGAVAAPAPLPSPLSLRDALAYAAEHNPSLLTTREQIREREGYLVEARARQIPQVSASASYALMDDSLVTGPGGTKLADDRNWQADVTVRQVLYAGGSVMAGVRAQTEQAEAAKLAYTAALNNTMLEVCQRFYGLLLSRELIFVHEENVKLLGAELQRARDRRASGAVSDFEVLRAEVSLANARPGLIRARNDARVAQNRLRQALGCEELSSSGTDEMALQGSLETASFEIALADALAKARAQRPELLQQERYAKAAEQGLVAARGGYQPTVSAYAGYEWTKASWSNRVGDSLNGWTAGLQANWAIFDGRGTAGRVQQARSQLRQIEHGTESMVQAIAVEVKQAHSSLIEAVELLASSAKVVEQAQESLRLAEVRQGAGTATQLDVLQAQTALTEARSNQAQARHAHVVAIAALQRAMGEISGAK